MKNRDAESKQKKRFDILEAYDSFYLYYEKVIHSFIICENFKV